MTGGEAEADPVGPQLFVQSWVSLVSVLCQPSKGASRWQCPEKDDFVPRSCALRDQERTGRGRAKQPPACDLIKEQIFGPSLNHSPAETSVGPSADTRANVMLGGKSPE